jgi:hypothetical protein
MLWLGCQLHEMNTVRWCNCSVSKATRFCYLEVQEGVLSIATESNPVVTKTHLSRNKLEKLVGSSISILFPEICCGLNYSLFSQ